MNFMSKFAVAVATCGYIGRIPLAPGTFGSLPGLLLYYAMARLQPAMAAVLLVAMIGLAVWSADRAEKIMEQKDPAPVVIDEVAGMGIVFAGMQFSLPLAAAGFILFRGVDIIKPFPIRWLESRLPGGFGVVADDLAAGMICRIILGIAGMLLAAWSGSGTGV